MNRCILSLIALPAMEDELIDWLLSKQEISGFTSQSANGHGSNHAMSLAEQVAGRRKQIAFLIELDQPLADNIIRELKNDFSGTGLHYWLSPLLKSGTI